MIEATQLNTHPGTVLQILPDDEGADRGFAGCFMMAEEIRSWGVQGFVQVPGASGGRAYVRITWTRLAWIGSAYLVPDDVIEKMVP